MSIRLISFKACLFVKDVVISLKQNGAGDDIAYIDQVARGSSIEQKEVVSQHGKMD